MTVTIRRLSKGRVISLVTSFSFAALCLFLAMPFLVGPKTSILTFSAGPEGTRRYLLAEYLVEQATQNDLSIQMVANAGSEDCLKLVKTGELDAAIVSSGVKIPADDSIMVLAGLDVEAVHVLVRKDLAEKGPLNEAIQGASVNLGERGSTEWLLSRELLRFAKLKLSSSSVSGGVIPTEYGKQALIDRCQAIKEADESEKASLIAELPDCLLLLATMPSTVAQMLIEVADYQIVPMLATRAFLLDDLQYSQSMTTIIEREFLEQIEIPEGSYFAGRAFPEAACETIGVRLLVIANQDVDPSAIASLMKTLFEGEASHRLQPTSPRDLATQYAIHPEAINYLDRDKPFFAVQETVEWMSAALSFFGAFSAGALSLYSLLRRKKTRAPSDYLSEIRKIGKVALAIDDNASDATASDLVKQLDDRLIRLRQDLIDDVCEGHIKGDQIVFSVLTLLKETRRDLPTLQAEKTGGTATAITKRKAA